MVAALTDRDLIYFTFNDEFTVAQLKGLVAIIEKYTITVGQMYKLIKEYADEIRHGENKPRINYKHFGIFQFLETKFDVSNN